MLKTVAVSSWRRGQLPEPTRLLAGQLVGLDDRRHGYDVDEQDTSFDANADVRAGGYGLSASAHCVSWLSQGRQLQLRETRLQLSQEDAVLVFEFPSPIVPDPVFFERDGRLIALVVLADGTFVHLAFPAPAQGLAMRFFHNYEQIVGSLGTAIVQIAPCATAIACLTAESEVILAYPDVHNGELELQSTIFYAPDMMQQFLQMVPAVFRPNASAPARVTAMTTLATTDRRIGALLTHDGGLKLVLQQNGAPSVRNAINPQPAVVCQELSQLRVYVINLDDAEQEQLELMTVRYGLKPTLSMLQLTDSSAWVVYHDKDEAMVCYSELTPTANTHTAWHPCTHDFETPALIRAEGYEQQYLRQLLASPSFSRDAFEDALNTILPDADLDALADSTPETLISQAETWLADLALARGGELAAETRFQLYQQLAEQYGQHAIAAHRVVGLLWHTNDDMIYTLATNHVSMTVPAPALHKVYTADPTARTRYLSTILAPAQVTAKHIQDTGALVDCLWNLGSLLQEYDSNAFGVAPRLACDTIVASLLDGSALQRGHGSNAQSSSDEYTDIAQAITVLLAQVGDVLTATLCLLATLQPISADLSEFQDGLSSTNFSAILMSCRPLAMVPNFVFSLRQAESLEDAILQSTSGMLSALRSVVAIENVPLLMELLDIDRSATQAVIDLMALCTAQARARPSLDAARKLLSLYLQQPRETSGNVLAVGAHAADLYLAQITALAPEARVLLAHMQALLLLRQGDYDGAVSGYGLAFDIIQALCTTPNQDQVMSRELLGVLLRRPNQPMLAADRLEEEVSRAPLAALYAKAFMFHLEAAVSGANSSLADAKTVGLVLLVQVIDAAVMEYQLTTMHINTFKHKLALNDVDGAFAAIAQLGAHEAIRDDCISELVSTLCDRNEMQAIVQLPYGQLEHIVRNVISTRARNASATAAALEDRVNFYQVLYAFFIFRADYAAAAQAMYIYASRLAAESLDPDTDESMIVLEAERDAYLTALNALQTLPTEHAWFAANVVSRDGHHQNAAPKRVRHGGEDSMDESQDIVVTPSSGASIVTAHELRCCYVLCQAVADIVDAKLPGYRQLSRNVNYTLAAEVLISARRYDDAINLVLTRARGQVDQVEFDFSSLFRDLTEQCLRISLETDVDVTWLYQNESPIAAGSTAEAIAWRLLRKYLALLDCNTTSFVYHEVVTRTILSLRPLKNGTRFPLPHWLLESHLACNPNALLALLLRYQMWDVAHQVAVTSIQEAHKVLQARDEGNTNLPRQSLHAVPFDNIERLQKSLQVVSGKNEALQGLEEELKHVLDRFKTRLYYQ
ncbi:uncharacterized protein MONBRDRAFT_34296 [Monosiga brevicollis MX1]|uniref:Uncharacterized protein n=1 Tax=Monosiga brevicollis TaxID=81824 RepID=A9VAT0_MONBE|nr:uncharacterized protein MONBRDRAFT_34296 [Monosiga brevicollis MX1]EDQ85374.1 predicted protein [Monosiga brevicollis MX1]|eukprot:XP_001749785.1 hypothetical protein [Monosiga brevicollis MX1]